MSGRLTGAGRSIARNVALVRAFRRSPTDFLDVLVASGAAAAPVRIGGERVLLVDDATQAWELLTAQARRTGKGRGLARARMLLGDGLLTSEGEAHRRQRRTLQPAFHPQQIDHYREHFAAAARRAAARWADGAVIELVPELSAITVDGAGVTLFGSDLREPAAEITRALTDLLSGFRVAIAPGGPVLLRTPLAVAVRVRSARAELARVVDDVVAGRWAQGATTPGSVLDLLASQPDSTPTQVRDEVMTLLLAGHETTAMTLTWALAAIEPRPSLRADLEAEWEAAVCAAPAESADALPLTMAVLAETLRLWPPSWMFTRRVLEPFELGGRLVPRGTMCLVSQALLHRDPRWWAEPYRFWPQRWLRPGSGGAVCFDPKAPGQPRGAYLPFGAGPRMCIGEQFAWSEAAAVLAELGRGWRLQVHGTPLTPGPSSITLRPQGPVRATTWRRGVSPAATAER